MLAFIGGSHGPSWVGCTPNRLASSDTVCSPFSASSATFALNSGLHCFRFDIVGLRQWATSRHGSVAYVTVRLAGERLWLKNDEHAPRSSARIDRRLMGYGTTSRRSIARDWATNNAFLQHFFILSCDHRRLVHAILEVRAPPYLLLAGGVPGSHGPELMMAQPG